MDHGSQMFVAGEQDGYMGFLPTHAENADYMAGYTVGQATFAADDERAREDDYMQGYDYWNEVEQGRWDDDPNPYHGDY